jgi:hypothetical protein
VIVLAQSGREGARPRSAATLLDRAEEVFDRAEEVLGCAGGARPIAVLSITMMLAKENATMMILNAVLLATVPTTVVLAIVLDVMAVAAWVRRRSKEQKWKW